jgi:chromosome segregation ATPase
MADSTSLIQSLLSGLISGGTTAGTAILAVFRDLKSRLSSLETKVGSDGDVKTGLFLFVDRLDESVRKLKRELESWQDDPPDWLIRMINRGRSTNSFSLEHHHELEQLVEARYKNTSVMIRRLEQEIEDMRKRLDSLVDRAEYERDGRIRNEEVAKFREQLATVNGLLRGVMTALGYLDSDGVRRG